MTAELYALTFAILVQMAAIGVAQAQMNRELGFRLNAGPRDAMPEFSPLLGRLRRAVSNGFEGLAMFAPAVLIIAVSGQSTTVTAIAAWVHVVARILFVPAYALGLTPGRSIIWMVGALANLVLLGSALI